MVEAPCEEVDLSRYPIGSSTFVVLQAFNGLACFRVLWWRVEVGNRSQVRELIQNVCINRVCMVEESLKVICSTAEDLMTVLKKNGSIS